MNGIGISNLIHYLIYNKGYALQEICYKAVNEFVER